MKQENRKAEMKRRLDAKENIPVGLKAIVASPELPSEAKSGPGAAWTEDSGTRAQEERDAEQD